MAGADPVIPGSNTAPFDPAQEAAELARLFYALSQALDDFRIDHWNDISPDDRGRLKDEAQALDTRAHYFTADAIGDTLRAIQGSLKNIKNTTADAKQAVATLTKVAKAISIATAGLALATAIAAGNIASIGSSVSGLAQAIAG